MTIKKEIIPTGTWDTIFYNDDPSLFNPMAFVDYKSPEDLLVEIDVFCGEIYSSKSGLRRGPKQPIVQLFYKGYPIHNLSGPALLSKQCARYVVNGFLHREDGAAMESFALSSNRALYYYYLKGIKLDPYQYLIALQALQPKIDLSPFLFDKDEALRTAAQKLFKESNESTNPSTLSSI